MAQLTWTKVNRAVRSQYSVSGQAQYAKLENVYLYGDDGHMVVTADIIASPGYLLVSLYRYTGNVFEDWQVTYTIPAETIALGKLIAERYIGTEITLRGLYNAGFTGEA